MLDAPYIDLKRFAVHDGPGIRTTLFLKGCSLHCLWCHNPESIAHKKELAIHYSKCTGCGECAKVCPNHKITEKGHEFDRENCTGCGKCEKACLYEALELYGKSITSGDAARLLLEDRDFYSDGGGITLSGGEPLLHADFCRELFELMKEENISCAVDTCGSVPWSAIEKVLPLTDIFLYDFKEADSSKHKAFTGCGNELILENLKKIDAAGKNIEIRMVQVPGLNMERSDLEGAGIFLSELKHVSSVRLLPYHALSHSKYLSVGRPDTMPEAPSPDESMLEESASILRSFGLRVINSLSKTLS